MVTLNREAPVHDDQMLPTFDEALQLTLAFYCIMEPEKRAVVMALVEKYADQSRLRDVTSLHHAVTDMSAVEPIARKSTLELERLIRQRDYAQQLKSLQFSVLE